MSEDKLLGTSDLAGSEADLKPTTPDFELDASEYLPELAEFELSDEQANELLQTLWSIMRTFVELGFEYNICEQLLADSDKLSDGGSNGVNCLPSTVTEMPSGKRSEGRVP